MTGREIMLLGAMLIVNCATKYCMESSEVQLWDAVKESKQCALQEKILRFEAEYTNEQMKGEMHAKRTDAGAHTLESTSSCPDSRNLPPKSVLSAPPVLESPFVDSGWEVLLDFQGASCETGDCLEEDDMVWTQEVAQPIPVKNLSKGQHVLCYDHLNKGLKHTEVLNVLSRQDVVQWATVELADGTTLRVTADHPFLTDAANGTDCLQNPLRAAHLRPGHDKVLVMKTLPVLVQAVHVQPQQDLKEQTRISVDVQQPLRHSVFVAQASASQGGSCAIAVGASNLEIATWNYRVRTRRTFLEIQSDMPSLRRCTSSPGCLQTVGSLKGPVDWRGDVKSSTNTSSGSIQESSNMSSDGNSKVRIGPEKAHALPDGRGVQVLRSEDGEHFVALQDYLSLTRAGFPSFGSLHHHDGLCGKACVFENRRQHGHLRKCSAGFLCDRCHFDHAPLKRRRRAGDV
jgi:hypothetical protein